MAAVFPAFSGFPPEEQGFYLEIYGASSSAVVIVKRLLGFFLYGIFVSFSGSGWRWQSGTGICCCACRS